MHPSHHLPVDLEKAQYDLHDNRVDDPGYRRFLSKVANPVLARLLVRSSVLDFGSGPGPALAAMLGDAGHTVALYDPFYSPDTGPLKHQYDAVTCTEVAEHFTRPRQGFDQLARLLKPGAWLAVMTCLQTDDDAFATWHYRRDPTHVSFYRARTLHWIAHHYGWTLEQPHKDVALFQSARVPHSATIEA